MKDLLTLAIEAAEKAGSRILTYYNLDNRNLGIQIKSDDSPVTLADLAADASIRNDLLTKTDYPVVSEEQLTDEKERLAYETYWLVDPLDGTKDFLQKNGEFTVNIALICKGEPIMGVIVCPALGECWYAARGKGAWLVRRNTVDKGNEKKNREESGLSSGIREKKKKMKEPAGGLVTPDETDRERFTGKYEPLPLRAQQTDPGTFSSTIY